MKKILSLVMACSIAITSFSAPGAHQFKQPRMAAWDIPLAVVKVKEPKRKFDDPYTINYWCLIGGTWYQPPYYLQLYAELNTNATVRWDVVFDVYGTWYGTSSPYKEFIVTIPAGNTFKLTNFTLNSSDQPDPNWVMYVSEGPH